jgi:lysophospholipase L1-like esterase
MFLKLEADARAPKIGMKLHKGTVFCCAGWLFAAVACLILLRTGNHFLHKLPSVQHDIWTRILAGKKNEFASSWRDARPLIIMAGDSQVELGDWYGLFAGAFAIRNCGLSQAKIKDVTELVSVIADRDPKMVVLMCGVNNLGRKDAVAACLNDYEQLLSVLHTSIRPQRIIVMSVMPVRETVFDRASHELNRQIVVFDSQLEALSQRHKAEFVNVNPAVTDDHGGLAANLTMDGLHLNREGYKRLAGVLAPLFANTNQPLVHGKN